MAYPYQFMPLTRFVLTTTSLFIVLVRFVCSGLFILWPDKLKEQTLCFHMPLHSASEYYGSLLSSFLLLSNWASNFVGENFLITQEHINFWISSTDLASIYSVFVHYFQKWTFQYVWEAIFKVMSCQNRLILIDKVKLRVTIW